MGRVTNSYSVGCAATGNGGVVVLFSPVVETYDIKTRQLVPKADFGGNYLQAKFEEADGYSAEYEVVSGSPDHVGKSFSNVETGDKVTLYYSTANGQNMETETVSLDQCAMEKEPEVPTTTTTTTVPTVETTPTTVPTTEVSLPPEATKPTLPETGIESGAGVGVAALLITTGAALSGLAQLLKRRIPKKTA